MVEYLEIFDKQYPVRIGYYVMKKVKEETGMSLMDALKEGGEDNLDVHETILFAALQMGAFAEKQDLDLEREDMPMVLDIVFTDYMKVFTSDKFFPTDELNELEEQAQEQTKKLGKATGKKKPQKRTKT